MPKTSNIAIIAAIIVIVAIAAVLLSTTSNQPGQTTTISQGKGISFASLSLTDPPQVPAGTSALVIDYSSLAVHATGAGWVKSNTSGSVNLLTLINTSQVLGNVNVSSNTTIDMARFYVSSAQITINGTTYNVTVPSGQVTAQLTTPSKVNGVTKVLVQLSPTVVTVFTNTTPEFILVPSVKAIAVGNASATAAPHAGARASLNESERADLEAATPNLTITGASLSQANGTTTLSVTVKDNSNASVDLQHIGVRGAENVSINMSAASQIANSIINRTDGILSHIQNESERGDANASGHADVSANGSTASANTDITVGGDAGTGTGSDKASSHSNSSVNMTLINEDALEIEGLSGSANITAFINAAVLNGTVNTTAFRAALVQKVRESLSAHLNNSEMFQEDNRALQFQILANGTLTLPFSEDQYENGFGYNLSSGQSHTFTFSEIVTLANGKLQVSLVPGSNYSITVQGEQGAMVSTNVTAN